MRLFLSLIAAAVLVAALPQRAAAEQRAGGRTSARATSTGIVNINTASAAELE